jgi:CheY-like chemotaxis protein
MAQRPLSILLVDDDEGAAVLFKLIVEKSGCDIRLEIAENGKQALEHLSNCIKHSETSDVDARSMPDLIVLDLMMPGISGFDVLDRLQRVPSLRALPVIAFSGSQKEGDREQALALGAARFINKPAELQELRKVVRDILDFAAQHQKAG